MDKMEEAKKLLAKMHEEFDEEQGLVGITRNVDKDFHFYSSGRVHNTFVNAEYAHLIYYTWEMGYYERAAGILRKLCGLQDKNPDSKTYGLWSVFIEDPLSQIPSPDYNMAEFVSAPMIAIMQEHSDCLDKELRNIIKESLRMAAICCLRRNVGMDYTNVVCMSIFTTVTIGEMINDEDIFKAGKMELQKFWEYTKFNGAFSEYNSPCYCRLAAVAIAKMLKYFKDPECVKMAEELNDFAWQMISMQYSNALQEFAPPYIRNYYVMDSGTYSLFIYMATGGRYGKKADQFIHLLLSDIHCPEKFYGNFEKEMWTVANYYRKNQLRERNEDVTIIQDFDSPDLFAYTYKTKEYLFGSLQKTELWEQRGTSMVIWNVENKRSLRLRGMKDDFDFSSAMAYTVQDRNKMLTLIGFSTDHGDKHYILDLLPDGKFKAKKLYFSIELSGACEDVKLTEQNGEYVFSDGQLCVSLKVATWVWDGKPAQVRMSTRGVELVCFEGETEREVDLTALKETYGVISLSIGEPAMDATVKRKNDRVIAEVGGGKYCIEGFVFPKPYQTCIREVHVKMDQD